MQKLFAEPVMRDKFSGENIYIYSDTYGREWMAEGSWSLFRVEYPPAPPLPLEGLNRRDREKMLDILENHGDPIVRYSAKKLRSSTDG